MDANTLSLVDSFFFPYVFVSFNDLILNMLVLDINNWDTSDNVLSLNYENPVITYHYSIPISKLAYPEPFIASASLMHSDLWFVHILIYQYWLWFVFVYLIIFFFVTFVCTVRWCNMRVQPRRETRGVSRSKCGDLITACVPVSWATSIIVHESTDAIDYYDGFGTSEMVVGIRAYQWGWEYYYPRDLDLNYTQRPSYSTFIGNSLRYESTSSLKSERSYHWKHLLTHANQRVSNTPSLLWLNTDRFNLLPITSGQTPLWTPLRNTSAFNQVRRFSKFSSYPIFSISPSLLLDLDNSSLLRFNPFYHENSGTSLAVPPFSLISSVNATSAQVTPISTIDAKILTEKKSHFKGSQTPLSKNFTVYANWRNKRAPSVSSSMALLTLSNFPSPSDFAPTSESSSLLSTDRTGRVIFNFSPSNPLFNQVLPLDNASPKENLGDSMVPSLLNQTRSFSVNSVPVASNRANHSLLTADESSTLNPMGVPTILLNKEELLPEWAVVDHNANAQVNTSSTWNLYFSNSRSLIRTASALPPFVPYNEYDFLDWQAFDLLENAYWDASSLNASFEDSILTLDTFFDTFFKFNSTRPFTSLGREHRSKKIPLTLVGALDGGYTPFFFKPSLFQTVNPHLIPPVTFNLSGMISEILSADSSYDVLKSSNDPVTSRHRILFRTNRILNLTRLNMESAFAFSSVFAPLSLWQASDLTHLNVMSDNPPSVSFLLSLEDFSSLSSTTRFDQLPSLRLPMKNVNITAQAMQKVFKTRFDELRSFTRPNDFSLVENRIPLISSPMKTLRSSLTKNSSQFDSVSIHRTQLSPLRLSFRESFNDIPAFELPIMLGLKSDPGRHIWIDWFARWGFYEVQPSSTARYAIYGMPYFSKLFDFSAAFNEEMGESENYFIRVARARRHYQPNWVVTPFSSNLNRIRFHLDTLAHESLNPSSIDEMQDLLSDYSIFFKTPMRIPVMTDFAPATSSSITYSRSMWQPHNHKELYNLYSTSLLDILTRREYISRLLLLKRAQRISLPPELIASTSNPIFELWESNFKLPLHLAHESSSTHYVIPSTLLKWTSTSPKEVDLHWGNMKNQYKPLRKGINNLLRLHASNAIALPCEIRLQILASSKDVIHSWAVPSAGIKIDCVPGYSSHKIMVFLLSGIFWGQCMEVCGRYHHWMPIVVYFMKRDMFVLWCTHFVFYDKNTQTLRNVSNSLNTQPRPVSYPIDSWRMG